MVDGVAHEVVVDADAAVAALELVAAAAGGPAAARAALRVPEGSDDELEAVGVGAPAVRAVAEGDEVGAGVDDAGARAERLGGLLARQVGLRGEKKLLLFSALICFTAMLNTFLKITSI